MDTDTRDDWLLVVDMQRVFGEPGSPWFSPAFADVAAHVEQLVPRFGDRTVFTRFLPTETEGSWADYYRRWSFAPGSGASPRWQLVPPWTSTPTVDTGTFSKWGSDLVAVVGERPRLVVCGVATDCCVLATVLAAVDAGAHVTVVADACGGSTPSAHEHALQLMDARAPQVDIIDAEGASNRWSKR